MDGLKQYSTSHSFEIKFSAADGRIGYKERGLWVVEGVEFAKLAETEEIN